MHKHQIDADGNWLRQAEYTPPVGEGWDNPFVLRVDQMVRASSCRRRRRRRNVADRLPLPLLPLAPTASVNLLTVRPPARAPCTAGDGRHTGGAEAA